MLPVLLQNWRDFREFVAAKKRKREPIQFRMRPSAEATYVPRHPQGFANFRAALRGVSPWGQASERLDALADALRRRHQCELPMPRKVIQNTDCSLSLWWGEAEHVMIRCFEDRFFSLIGGTKGLPMSKVTTDLVDALYMQHRIQNAA